MPQKRETLGWGTMGFWFAVLGIAFLALLFGVFVPTGTQQQVTDTEITDPAQPQQPPGPAR